jgi:hypothetical protein
MWLRDFAFHAARWFEQNTRINLRREPRRKSRT